MPARTSELRAPLFFEDLIKSYIDSPRFLTRPWLELEMQAALADPKNKFVLMIAEPSAGKTAFMAWLARQQPDWPRYFIRRDSREPLQDPSARSLLLRVGYQMKAIHPKAFRADHLQIAIKMRVGKVMADSQVIGAEVDRLLASPFRQTLLDIEMKVDETSGRTAGLRVKEWVSDPNLLSPADLLNMALVDPAAAIPSRSRQGDIVVLVDALDEVRYHPQGADLLQWLAQIADLPGNIRFILSSREDVDGLTEFINTQRTHLQVIHFPSLPKAGDAKAPLINLDTRQESLKKDLEAYAHKLAEEPPVKAVLETGQGTAKFVSEAVEKAEGNLGYLDALARAIDDWQAKPEQGLLQELLALKSLPPSLSGLYAFFLNRVRTYLKEKDDIAVMLDTGKVKSFDAWTYLYRKVLGVLTVAKQPMTAPQVHRYSGTIGSLEDVERALGQLSQFLDMLGDAYRLYHATLPEFMINPATRGNPETAQLAVDVEAQHLAVVEGCRKNRVGDEWELVKWKDVDWQSLDGYGLRYLPAHLYDLRHRAEYSLQLHHLLEDETYTTNRLQRWPNPAGLLDDLRLAMRRGLEAGELGWAWKNIRRYRSIVRNEASIQSLKNDLARKDYPTALERTSLFGNLPNSQALVRLWLAWNAADEGQNAIAEEACRQAFQGLPDEGFVGERLSDVDGTAEYVVKDAMRLSLTWLISRVAQTIATTFEKQSAWVAKIARNWSKERIEDLQGLLAKPLDDLEQEFGYQGETTSMESLFQMLANNPPIDSYDNFRNISFQYHRRLAAGLFRNRDDPAWDENVRKTVDLIALDDYPSYREIALAWITVAVLAEKDPKKARDALAEVLRGVFDNPEPGFWGDTIAAALDGLDACRGLDANDVELLQILETASVDPSIQRMTPRFQRDAKNLPPDPWAFEKLRRSAVAARLYDRGETSKAKDQMVLAGVEDYQNSYAGYRALARLGLAFRWLEFADELEADRQLNLAAQDAGNMLDPVLRRERAALVGTVQGWVKAGKANAADLDLALKTVQEQAGMARPSYVQYLASCWHTDPDRLTRLVPMMMADATSLDAVFGRLVRLVAKAPGAEETLNGLIEALHL